jgi:UDP-N-acetylmuramyl-tripeptide synthetase
MALQVMHDDAQVLAWLQATGARALAADSRALVAGEVFVAWPGQAHDARAHLGAAHAAGAVAALVEADGLGAFTWPEALPVVALPGLKARLGELAHQFYREPSQALALVTVTGTNGKTSSAWWIAQALTQLGRRCGVVGTLGVGEPPQVGVRRGQAAVLPLEPTGLTTPGPVTLHASLRRMLDAGFSACAMEASSIGIEEQRLNGARVAVAVLTNFTQDHLDYHGDMSAYWAAKAKLFAWPGLRSAVINIDDPQGAQLAQELAGRGLEVWSLSVQGPARLRAHALHYADGGLAFDVSEGVQSVSVRTGLIGDYNAANLLGVMASLRALGVPLNDAASACAGLTPVPGRMQRVAVCTGGPIPSALLPEVVVDYAHTPDALDKALRALQPLAQARGGRLWCVFGCGGNRDAAKRPQMAAIAEALAQAVVVTSDNPRLESPSDILGQIAAGLREPQAALLIEDRAQAIAQTLAQADSADVVLIAGKGHEDYQDIGGVKKPFSDVDQAQQALRLRLINREVA